MLVSSASSTDHDTDHGLQYQRQQFAEISRRTGCQFDLQTDMPRARQWTLFLNGQLPVVSAALQKPERDRVGWFEQYENVPNVLLVRNSYAGTRDVPSILRDPRVRIGIVRGYILGGGWDQLLVDPVISARIQNVGDLQTIMHMMSRGRIDATVSSPAVYADLLTAYDLKDQVTAITWPEAKAISGGIYLSRKALTKDAAEKIGRAIEAMLADHSMARIWREVYQNPGDGIFDFVSTPVDFSN